MPPRAGTPKATEEKKMFFPPPRSGPEGSSEPFGTARQEFLPHLPWDPERKQGGTSRTQTSRIQKSCRHGRRPPVQSWLTPVYTLPLSAKMAGLFPVVWKLKVLSIRALGLEELDKERQTVRTISRVKELLSTF